MKTKWIFLMVLIGLVCAFPYTASAIGFAVGPPSINLILPENGENTTTIYVTSYDYNGNILVGTEDIPFRVSPEVIPLNDTDQNKRVELTLYGNKSAGEGIYSGSLTFLGSTGNNVASGVKVSTNVTQTCQSGALSSIIDAIRVNYIMILIAIMVVVSLIIGIMIGRRGK